MRLRSAMCEEGIQSFKPSQIFKILSYYDFDIKNSEHPFVHIKKKIEKFFSFCCSQIHLDVSSFLKSEKISVQIISSRNPKLSARSENTY